MLSETDLASLIGAIYEAGVDFTRWPQALTLLATALGGHAAGLARQGPTPAQCWGVNARIDPAFERAYIDHFHEVNPVWRNGAAAPAGSVMLDTMMVSRPVLAQTEFFQDFMRPQEIGGMLNCVALIEDGRQTNVTVHATRPWEAEHLTVYALLMPHLRRAVEINVQLANADANRIASEALLNRLGEGVLFVDADARILFANDAAEALLRDDVALRQSGGVIAAGSSSETAALHRAVGACAGAAGLRTGLGEVLLFARGPGRPPLSLRVAPAPVDYPLWIAGPRPVAVLTVDDPERNTAPPPHELRRRFGLTRAQAALALEILNGDGIQAAADRLAVSRATARTHLARIFEKTGTQRQSELVRLLMSLRPAIRPD